VTTRDERTHNERNGVKCNMEKDELVTIAIPTREAQKALDALVQAAVREFLHKHGIVCP